MEKLKKNKFVIVFLLILIIISIILLYFKNRDNENYYEQAFDITLKHYEENEYIPVNISYDQMARIYLQDYVYKLNYEREEAYRLLDDDYRRVKFSSYDKFDEYVEGLNSLKFQEMQVVDYAFTKKNNFNDFDVHDSAGNLFIFRETGVMQYTVFFDRFTVDMR